MLMFGMRLGGRPAYRGHDDAAAREIDPRSGARPDLRRDPRLDDKPFLVDDARQRLIDEIDRIRARKEQKGE